LHSFSLLLSESEILEYYLQSYKIVPRFFIIVYISTGYMSLTQMDIADNTDEVLILGIASGAIESFDTLFRRYEVSIYGYIRRSVTDPEISADLTQTVWEKVFARSEDMAARIQDPSKEFGFKPYLFRMATNLINDHYRSPVVKYSTNPRQSDGNDDIDVFNAVPSTEISPEGSMVLEELGNCIDGKMTRVSTEFKRTFDMTRDNAVSYSEASQALGVSAETIRSRVKAVLKLIKPCLEAFKNG
jgi:RNA polymerase sigma factor (sigma-70 family)